MAIDGKLMAKARERLAAIKENNEKLQEERLLEVYSRVPEVRRIDAALRGLMGEVISASLKKGEAAARALENAPRSPMTFSPAPPGSVK